MANKKIITLLLLIVATMFVASVAMGAATAAEEAQIGDLKFKLPDGYKENSSGSEGNTQYKVFINGDKAFVVNVIKLESKQTKVALNPGDVEKEIEGVNGSYNENQSSFNYLTKDQKHMIFMSGDMNAIHDFLKLNKE